MARDIDRKLRATAAVLGLITRKDLAAAFRRVNAATTFDLERAHKWLQGRSSPRDARLYQDWTRVLDIDQSAEWIANCEFDAFLEVVARRYNVDRDALSRQGTPTHSGRSGGANDAYSNLAGTYVCYSNSWSPYFRGHMIRGALTVADAATPQVVYSEVLPTGQLQVSGTLSLGNRAMHMTLREASGDAQFLFCLFPPTAPVRVLGGLMCGATLIGPDSSPSVTRIIMIRLPATSDHLHSANAYLPKAGSFAQDLASLGLPVSSAQLVDERLSEFLCSGDGKGLDQPSTATYRAIVELFDREWLYRLNEDSPPMK
ncbi:hypothetical protein [Microvirga arabica]|uniref:hypothetical protein n=1 Tax=Microvirga arabica TaxID=1128671 RepID=UPI00193A2092|nr:hypothetical protein [Microvirga arabica]MBM1172684.1 hypothetical protein [Microvirga arabica]